MISLSRNLGLLVARRYWSYQAPLCRDHGIQLARNWLVATLLMGWWGVISFMLNVGAVAGDLGALMAARRLAPAGAVLVPGGFGMAESAPSRPLPRVPFVHVLVTAFAIVAVAAVGVFEAFYGPQPVAALRVGDCFDAPSTGGVISEIPRHPCSEAHSAEVFAFASYAGGPSATYPTDAEFVTFAKAQCGPAFNDYTGGGAGQAATVNIDYMTPTEVGWSHGLRTVMCYLSAPAGQTLNQSLRQPNHT